MSLSVIVTILGRCKVTGQCGDGDTGSYSAFVMHACVGLSDSLSVFQGGLYVTLLLTLNFGEKRNPKFANLS